MPGASATEPRPGQGRWKLCTCSIRATLLIQNGILTAATGWNRLENERREPFQAGQDRNRRVEKHPVPEIAVRVCHDHGPRRLGRGENPHQPPALPKLPPHPLPPPPPATLHNAPP